MEEKDLPDYYNDNAPSYPQPQNLPSPDIGGGTAGYVPTSVPRPNPQPVPPTSDPTSSPEQEKPDPKKSEPIASRAKAGSNSCWWIMWSG